MDRDNEVCMECYYHKIRQAIKVGVYNNVSASYFIQTSRCCWTCRC